MLWVFLFVSLALGVTLGQIFRVFVLLPTSLVVAVLTVGAFQLNGHGLLYTLFETGAVLTALQLGYVLGLLPRLVRLRLRPPVTTSVHSPIRRRARRF
jgi:hypothetical protein